MPAWSAATTEIKLNPGNRPTSALNLPTLSTRVARPSTCTEAPGVAVPGTTTALLVARVPSAGPKTRKFRLGILFLAGVAVGLAVGVGTVVGVGGGGVGVGALVGSGVDVGGIGVSVGSGVGVGTSEGVGRMVAVGSATVVEFGPAAMVPPGPGGAFNSPDAVEFLDATSQG